MPLQIRPARQGDSSELADLLNEIIARGGTTALEEPFTAEALDAAYLTGPDVICCFVATDKASSRLEGFQTLCRYPGLPDDVGDIGTFARVGGTKRGVGSALFAATRVEARRRGLAAINATIRADNTGGLAFYGRMGFEDDAVRSAEPLNNGTLVDRISKRYPLAPAGASVTVKSSDNRFVLITGCSGGGKSTLVSELKARGHLVVEEPGRRIVRHEVETGGRALPWIDEMAFARRAIAMALADRDEVKGHANWVFFDRGLIDAASALEHLGGQPVLRALDALHPYHRRVFLAPPWPEIHVTDAERRHGLTAAVEEYERLSRELPSLGYDIVILPKASVSARAEFVLAALET